MLCNIPSVPCCLLIYKYCKFVICIMLIIVSLFVEECISERESRRFEEGLNTKVKLDIYKRFGKSVEFKFTWSM